MNASSLESKTIRPGSLGSYSYYYSNRRPAAPQRPAYITGSSAKLIPRSRRALVIVAIMTLVGLPMFFSYNNAGTHSEASKTAAAKTSAAAARQSSPHTALAAGAITIQPAASPDHCAGNTEGQLILVSVTQRRLWACEGGKTVHQSAVITGQLAHESTVTPPGTYHIYSKTTDTTLTGTDETGSWNDPVYYWMPFLDNQYGTYGFHDATWRSDSEFGTIDPNSDKASHGCIELPLGASKWLYNWAATGTTVTVES